MIRKLPHFAYSPRTNYFAHVHIIQIPREWFAPQTIHPLYDKLLWYLFNHRMISLGLNTYITFFLGLYNPKDVSFFGFHTLKNSPLQSNSNLCNDWYNTINISSFENYDVIKTTVQNIFPTKFFTNLKLCSKINKLKYFHSTIKCLMTDLGYNFSEYLN